MTTGLKTFYAAALAGSLLLSGAAAAKVMAGDDQRGNSRSPHLSRNSTVPLQRQVNKIKKEIRVDQTEIDEIKSNLQNVNTDVKNIKSDLKKVDTDFNNLTAHVQALEAAAPQPELLWINHHSFLVDATSGLSASFVANPLGGWSGLVVRAVRAVADQIMVAGLQVPPRYNVTKVRICYELSSAASFITHIKITQLTSPSNGVEVLTDLNDKTSVTPICADSAPAAAPISPTYGPLRLNLGATIANPTDLIVIRAVGLYLEPAI